MLRPHPHNTKTEGDSGSNEEGAIIPPTTEATGMNANATSISSFSVPSQQPVPPLNLSAHATPLSRDVSRESENASEEIKDGADGGDGIGEERVRRLQTVHDLFVPLYKTCVRVEQQGLFSYMSRMFSKA